MKLAPFKLNESTNSRAPVVVEVSPITCNTVFIIAFCTVVVELEIASLAVEVASPPTDIVPSAPILRTFAPVLDARVNIGEVVAIAWKLNDPFLVEVPIDIAPLPPMSNKVSPVPDATRKMDDVAKVDEPTMLNQAAVPEASVGVVVPNKKTP